MITDQYRPLRLSPKPHDFAFGVVAGAVWYVEEHWVQEHSGSEAVSRR